MKNSNKCMTTASLTKQKKNIRAFYKDGSNKRGVQVSKNLYNIYKNCGGKLTHRQIVKK